MISVYHEYIPSKSFNVTVTKLGSYLIKASTKFCNSTSLRYDRDCKTSSFWHIFWICETYLDMNPPLNHFKMSFTYFKVNSHSLRTTLASTPG